MESPTNAHAFVNFMTQVWHIESAPHEGGITLWASPLYDEYADAIVSAKRFGARRTGGSHLDGKHAHVFRFQSDGDYCAVVITHDGAACRVSQHHYGRRPKS
jgi:hypothetical protein